MQKRQNQTSSHKHSHKKMGDKTYENRTIRRTQSKRRDQKNTSFSPSLVEVLIGNQNKKSRSCDRKNILKEVKIIDETKFSLKCPINK